MSTIRTFSRYSDEWEKIKHTDPAHVNTDTSERFYDKTDTDIQDSSHCPDFAFPTNLRRFGFQTVTYGSLLDDGLVGDEWSDCALQVRQGMAMCCPRKIKECDECSSRMPAFLYTHPDITCWRAKKKNVPTVFGHFVFQEASDGSCNRVRPQACVFCTSRSTEHCEINAIWNCSTTTSKDGGHFTVRTSAAAHSTQRPLQQAWLASVDAKIKTLTAKRQEIESTMRKTQEEWKKDLEGLEEEIKSLKRKRDKCI